MNFSLFKFFNELVYLSGVLATAPLGRCGCPFGGGGRRLTLSTVHSIRGFGQSCFHFTLSRNFFLFGGVRLQVFDLLFLLHQLFGERLGNQPIERKKGSRILSADFDAFHHARFQEVEIRVVLDDGSQPRQLLLSALGRQFGSLWNGRRGHR